MLKVRCERDLDCVKSPTIHGFISFETYSSILHHIGLQNGTAFATCLFKLLESICQKCYKSRKYIHFSISFRVCSSLDLHQHSVQKGVRFQCFCKRTESHLAGTLQLTLHICCGANGDGNSSLFKLPQIQHYINGTFIRELYDREIYRPGTLRFVCCNSQAMQLQNIVV
ncbi:hypothetical protein EMCRGX_G010251 [Ephydatia muelleri]